LIKPSDLEAEAERLIAEGKMPSLEEVLAALEEARNIYRDKILEARRRGTRTRRLRQPTEWKPL